MRPHQQRRLALTLGLLSCFLSACGGGGSGTGGDQPPDPVQEDIAIAYIARSLPTQLDNATQQPVVVQQDLLEPAAFHPGARLVVRARATPGAMEKVITDRVFGANAQYDVKDLEVSYDGKKLLFSMRAPAIEGADEDEQPTWDIWEYNLDTDSLRRVIDSDVVEAQGQDINPHYLPDGRIVFSSTRQLLAKSNLLDEGKPQYAPQGESGDDDQFALHVMNNDGSNITQLTFNTSHEIEPVVNRNGEIVYLRWDAVAGHDAVDFYALRPDGTEHRHLYGRNSHNTGTHGAAIDYRHLQLTPDGRLLALIGPRRNDVYGGQLIYVDTDNFSDNEQPVPDSTSSASSAQTNATHFPVGTDGEPSLGGYLSAAFPLWDGTPRMLISWSECMVRVNQQTLPCTQERLDSAGAVVQRPAYGLWMYNTQTQTLLPLEIAAADRVYTDIVVMQERSLPPVLTAKTDDGVTYDSDLADDNVGLLHIRSVYDLDGKFYNYGRAINSLAQMRTRPLAQRPALFLRVEKAVLRPDRDVREVDNSAYGVALGGQNMRDILGYAPIEPDGSVKVKISANVPFTLSILDANGQSISPRHQYWLQMAPGEIVTCNGCHNPNSTTPHGRTDARPASINRGATTNGRYTGLNPAYSARAGETMAETRARVDAASSIDSTLLSASLVFDDVWSLTPPARVVWQYSDLDELLDVGNDPVAEPTNASCEPVWTALCRTTIHYPIHIAPLWDRLRTPLSDPFTSDPLTDGNGDPVDQCTDCHSRGSDIFGDLAPGTPSDGTVRTQLDLTNQPSTDEPDHFTSYRYLFAAPRAAEYNDQGELVDKPLRDENGDEICALNPDGSEDRNPITHECNSVQYDTVDPVMSGGGARASADFFAPFRDGGRHEGWLSPAELKLLSEWLDIGGQYYNDPFAAPQN